MSIRIVCLSGVLAFAGLSAASAADADPATPAQHQTMDALLREGLDAKVPSKGIRSEVRQALAACAAARHSPQRVGICRAAHDKYEACKRDAAVWEARRTVFIAELDARRPELGQNCPGVSPGIALSGMPMLDRWNCSLNTLRTLKLPGCPGFLPDTWNTPLQALAAWEEEDRIKSASIRGGDAKPGGAAGSEGFTSSLFQQSAAQASGQPDAASALAVEARKRQAEVDQLTANGQQRQAAIMGTMVSSVTQAMQTTAAGGGPSTSMEALSSVLSSAQGHAGGGAGGGGAAGGAYDTDGVQGPSLGYPPQSGTCKEGAASLGRELDAITARKPASTGAVESLQYAMYVLQRSIDHLSGPSCSGDPGAASALAERRAQYKVANQNCMQITSDTRLCFAKKPNW